MLIPFLNSTHINTRGTSNQNLFIPACSTDYIRKSFFTDVAMMWNTIPKEIKNLKNSIRFKEKLQSFLFTGNR